MPARFAVIAMTIQTGVPAKASTLRPPIDTEMPMILRWRNHPQVRGVMFSNHEISEEEHCAWWEKVQNDPTRQVLLFMDHQHPRGVVNLFDIDLNNKSCHWGFYLDNEQIRDNAERLKLWLTLEQAVIDYVFDHLDMQTLLCETFASNRAVHQLHSKFGFQEINRVMDKNSREVVVMQLNKSTSKMERTLPTKEKTYRPAIKFAFLGSANWDLAGKALVQSYEKLSSETIQVLPIPFGQHRQQIFDEQDSLIAREPDYTVFCERVEDLCAPPFSKDSARELEQNLEEYCQFIEQARSRLPGIFFILDFAPVRPILSTLEDTSYDGKSILALIEQLNVRLEKFCQKIPDCSLIRLSTLVHRLGTETADPGKYWFLGRIPFSVPLTNALCQELVKFHIALTGRTARVLVTDLDNTLWGGVVGDDGLEGIKIGGDFPGNIFTEFQLLLRQFRDRGLALAICSKNTETVVRDAFTKHPAMKLKLTDFASLRINWRDKAENLREIADEIGVGLSSLCFLDDSPYEREAIRQLLPEVIVPELPDDMTLWPSFLLSCPHLAMLRPTAEDLKRVRNYEIRSLVKAEASSFTNKQDYWRNLDMKLFFHRYAKNNRQRVLQLLAKTNQFNMTTRRHNEQDLERLLDQRAEIIPIGLADKYSDEEIIGLIILVPEHTANTVAIETFLLSCRVLGRSVETGILAWVCEHLLQKGVNQLDGLFFSTERNLPAADVYSAHGFFQEESSRFRLNLNTSPVSKPDWFQYSDEAS